VNVVDSSGWLEYFADGPEAEHFAAALEDLDSLVVPTVCLVEVAKIVRRERGEHAAFQATAQMELGKVAVLDAAVAKLAAGLGVHHKLPLADSIILATARIYEATVWTQDEDFADLPGVKYFPKRKLP
jgi:predicted nucleic acid-binding protein